MKSILFFFPGPLTIRKRDSIQNTVNIIRQQLSMLPYALTETKEERQMLRKVSNWENIFSVRDEVKKIEYVGKSKKKAISDRYRRHCLQKLRIGPTIGPMSLLNQQHVDVSDEICRHIEFFETLLGRLKFDYACVAYNEAYSNSLVPILDAVCKELFIETIYLTHPFHRIIVTDNMARASTSIQSTYLEKLSSGVSTTERVAIKAAIDSYIEFKRSRRWADHIRKSPSKRNILKALATLNLAAILRSITPSYESVAYRLFCFYYENPILKTIDSMQYKLTKDKPSVARCNEKYALLILNKDDNYRMRYISPYYSETTTILRNISISLPLTHTLRVRDHPGSRRPKVELSIEARRLGNVFFDCDDSDFFELISLADIVFTVASSASLDAVIMGTPVITFGNLPYLVGEHASPIRKCNNWEELPRLISECLEEGIRQKEIDSYFYSFLNHSEPMNKSPDTPDWLDSDFDPRKTPEWYDFGSDRAISEGEILAKYLADRTLKTRTAEI